MRALPQRVAQRNELLSSLSRLQSKTQHLSSHSAPSIKLRPQTATSVVRSPPTIALSPHPRGLNAQPWSPRPKSPRRRSPRRLSLVVQTDEEEDIYVRKRRPEVVVEPPRRTAELKDWSSRGARDRARAALQAELSHHAEDYLELRFEAEAEGLGDRAVDAAGEFDERYLRVASEAREQLVEATFNPALGTHGMLKAMRELRYRSKYFIPETVEVQAGVT